jgi:exopolysaccharide biosynthesis polyprenyl glycosylphosphotransferase
VFRRHYRKAKVLFALFDILLTFVAFEAAYQFRSHLSFAFEKVFFLTPEKKALLLVWSAVVWVGVAIWWDLYGRLETAGPFGILRDVTRQVAAAGVGVVLIEYLLRLDLSRSFLILFLGLSWVMLALFRLNARRIRLLVRRGFGEPHYLMIVGLGENARRFGSMLEASSEDGMRLSGFLADSADPTPAEVQLRQNNYPVYPLERLPELLESQVIDELVFAVDSRRLGELEEVFLICDSEGIRTHIAVDFFPHINSRVYLEQLGGKPLLTFSATPYDEVRLLAKRSIDVLLAGTALLILSPLLALVAVLIRVTSSGPAIFRQKRCGLNGRNFTVYKFRSMVDNAEDLKPQLKALNERDQTVFKIRQDPRLTPIGKWLRKFSIDELPQLWNVLKGDMSLVGPRPAVPEEVEQYKRWQRRRLRMRPGLTCLWAISGRDALDFETWMKLDMHYIDHWSLGLDWKIILRTIPLVLSGKGAH